MKKYILTLAGVAFVSTATAQSGFYLKGGVGLNKLQNSVIMSLRDGLNYRIVSH